MPVGSVSLTDMVNFCAVYGCSNRSNRDKQSFYCLPSVPAERYSQKRRDLTKKRRETWLRRIRREDLLSDVYAKNVNLIRVCSDHFISGKSAAIFDEDNPDWAASQNLGHKYSEVKANSVERHGRVQQRSKKRARSESALALKELQNQTWHESQTTETTEDFESGIHIQTDITSDVFQELRRENKRLKEELCKYNLDLDGLIGNDEKTLHFTGFPNWQLLFCLYEYVKEYLSNKGDNSIKSSLSSFQKLVLTLMRMKLNLYGKDLTYRFGGVSESTVSRTFIHVLDILYASLKPLIRWPERDELKKTMPMDFRKHSPNCIVIIDCFEIFLDRATNPLARAQTHSSYKHHNTVKYLIGITPQGTVSFISDGWGGRVSDKHLTEESGLLDKLYPGDVILAYRGFDIVDSVGLHCATVKLPAFTKGKKQLSGIEVEQTRRIANLRIHVERVIGNIRKKYSILGATQSIDFVKVRSGNLTTLDKIVTVCCALANMCDSVVPFE